MTVIELIVELVATIFASIVFGGAMFAMANNEVSFWGALCIGGAAYMFATIWWKALVSK